MDDKKNIFVLFAPGNGGNHVANLLSTDPLFPARATLMITKTIKEKTPMLIKYKISNLNTYPKYKQ